MSEARAQVTRRRRISMIWLVPIVALMLGAWMVYYTWSRQGPEIAIVFSTAEGVEAGKTKLKARNVQVGTVTSVVLGDDLESVVVTAELDPGGERLLRQDTQLWVVRARVGAGGITGLGTIVSGGYIELAPGTGEEGRRRFVGLEEPPVTKVGAPGLKFELTSGEAGSLTAGDAILYKGFRVGRVESASFDVETQTARYDAFIDAPYDTLVTRNTRFWNVSGVHFSATADGIELSTGSLQSLLLGGVTFGVVQGRRRGDPVQNGAVFRLYNDEQSAHERPYHQTLEYVVRFERSVRGLRPGAPVEYRGLPAGRVERILLDEMVEASGGTGEGAPIPVLIVVEPGRLAFGDDEEGRERLRRGLELAVPNGMRATLASGNLLTGSLLVALDEYPDAAPAEMGDFAGYPTIPTIASGLEGLQHQLQALLEKLNSLPIEDVVASADGAVREVEHTLASLNAVIASEGIQTLPASLEATLAELDRTLRRVSDLAASLQAQPSSLIFSRQPQLDPEPPARSR